MIIEHERAATNRGRLAVLLLVVLAGCTHPATVREEVSISSGDAMLAGTMVMPAGEGRRPAVVLVHGSGPDGRSNEYYWMLAKEFNDRGFAVLIYDKRGSESSTGDWRTAPFGAVIDDAVAAATWLRRHPQIDSSRVGVWGGSEGATIAPEVALRAGLAFVVAQSASGVTFAEQNLHQTDLQVRGMTADPAQHAAAMKLQRMKHRFARKGEGWPEYQAALTAAAGTEYRGLAGPSARDNWWWAWYRTKMDYSALPALQQLRAPVLAIWGSEDALIPVTRSAAAFRESRSSMKMPADSFVVVEGADHTLYINGLRGLLRRSLRNRPVSLDLAAGWAARQVGGR